MHRMALLGVVCAWLLSSSARAQPAPTSVSPGPCGPALITPLWAAVPEPEREGFSPEPLADESAHGETAPRLVEVELDGAAPREVVLALDALGDGAARGRSAVWVFTCRGSSWAPVGRLDFENDAAWDGTIDDLPGVRVLRAEAIPGVGHDLLRVEHVDVRGGHDPRYARDRLLLVHVVGGALVTALDLVVSESTEAGPDRAEIYRATRTLVLRRGARPRYRLTVQTAEHEGRPRTCRTVLTFDGSVFRPADAACAAR